MDTTTVAAQIPADLAALLTRMARAEDRCKSCCACVGLEMILRQRLEYLEDYETAIAAQATFEASDEAALTMDQVFGRDRHMACGRHASGVAADCGPVRRGAPTDRQGHQNIAHTRPEMGADAAIWAVAGDMANFASVTIACFARETTVPWAFWSSKPGTAAAFLVSARVPSRHPAGGNRG